ncbi:MAG TPA: MBL fold metallo-hydrolase [Candidatus Dormibacteraeota bacterium]|nr:MBL fold metallo-hydrolase [Candidatus Dormibacteraeota bacterium]
MTAYVPSSSAWAEGGPEEVAEGLFRIPLPLPNDGLRAVNAYLWRGAGGDLLIDCGWVHPLSWEALTSALTRFGSGLKSIRQLFATHVHGDHLGAAGQIREAAGAFVTLGLGDRETAQIMATDPALARARTKELLLRHGASSVVEALDQEAAANPRPAWLSPLPDLFLSDGELRFDGRALEVLPTPGHTRGHLCLWDPSTQILFAGDHVLPHITPSIGVEVPVGGLPLLHFLHSLEKVRDLPAQLVLPAHGPTFPDLAGRVDQLLEHHRLRLQLCQEAVQGGSRSALDVAQAVPWTRRRKKFSELDAFNQMLAVNETVAHLELLAERGELSLVLSNLVVLFTPGPSGPQSAEAH